MPSANGVEKTIRTWLQKSLVQLDPELNLAYVEWNEGWENFNDYRSGKPKAILFSMFGYAWKEAEEFDPEDPDHLDHLAYPRTGSNSFCRTGLGF